MQTIYRTMNFLLGNLGRKLDNGEDKGSSSREERRKNRHGIVVEEMALRPLNSRLLSSQPRNSAYFQLNLLIIAPPLWNSSSPLLLRLLFIRSVESPARGGHYTVSSSRYPTEQIFFVIYRASRGMVQEDSADHSSLGSIMRAPLGLYSPLLSISFIGIKNKFGQQLWTKGKRRIFERWTLKEFDGELKKRKFISKIGRQASTGFVINSIYCYCCTKYFNMVIDLKFD